MGQRAVTGRRKQPGFVSQLSGLDRVMQRIDTIQRIINAHQPKTIRMNNSRILTASVIVYMALTGCALFTFGRTFSNRGFEDIEAFELAATGAGFNPAQTELLRSTLLTLHRSTDAYVSSVAGLVSMATVLVLIIPIWAHVLSLTMASPLPAVR